MAAASGELAEAELLLLDPKPKGSSEIWVKIHPISLMTGGLNCDVERVVYRL